MHWRRYFTESTLLQSFLITLLLFAVSYVTVGWWTDVYQHFYDTAISGELTDYYANAAANPFPEYMPGASVVLNWLGKMYPIRWVAFFLNGILFLSLWVLFNLILKYSISFPWQSRLVLVLFFCVLFFESVVLYHMVRITMFAGIASVSFLIVYNENKILSKRVLPYLLLFVVALWIRCNVHLFVLIFITAVFIVHSKPLKPLVPFWLAFAVFFGYAAKVEFLTDYSKDLSSYFLYNAEFKLYFVGKYTPDLKLTEPLDSIKYQAIKHDILGDELNLSPAFYDRIGIFSNISKFSASQAVYAVQTFLYALVQNVYFIIADIVLIFFYVWLGGNKLKRYKTKTIGLFVFFYLVVFGICFIKMENRFLVPFQVLFLFTIITLHQPKLFSDRKNLVYLLLFAALIFPLSISYTFKKIDYSIQRTAISKNAFEWLGKRHSDKTVVVNAGFVTQNRPYETFYQRKYFKNFYLFNYYASHLSAWYRPYIEKECQCNAGTLYPFYDFLASQKQPVLLLDGDERIKVLEKYLSQVYGKTYVIAPEPAMPLGDDTSTLRFNGFRSELNIFSLKAVQ